VVAAASVEARTGELETVHLAEALFEAYNAHDIDRIGTLLSETFLAVSQEGPIGPYGWKRLTVAHFKQFPDAKWTKVRLSNGTDRFLLEVLFTGTERKAGAKTRTEGVIRLDGLVKQGKIETLKMNYDAGEFASREAADIVESSS
jgi:SnoaL-like protein